MPYEYTKPRGPVAAMYSSPGPCYALPSLIGAGTQDSSQQKAPAYHFGLKHKQFSTDTSPGPIYSLPKLKVSHKNSLPVWTLASRKFPPTEAKLNVPGPGTYDLRGKCLSESAPAFSFGTRPKGRQVDTAPGPNIYSLPPIVGNKPINKSSAPQYTMVSRSLVGGFSEDLQKTPGPGAYDLSKMTDKFKTKAPVYSITSRTYMPEDATIKPGPGAHSVENSSHVVGQRNPAYSFGLRHSQYTAPIADITQEEE
ncbi:ciliary microtubule associated protein 1A-like [Watersipora subatra]|uniref:ciliary microtubule associated protein 1A-like n=1 Tax=Watersipora subatra TaxID=2589382 RepID=UPI00355BE016